MSYAMRASKSEAAPVAASKAASRTGLGGMDFGDPADASQPADCSRDVLAAGDAVPLRNSFSNMSIDPPSPGTTGSTGPKGAPAFPQPSPVGSDLLDPTTRTFFEPRFRYDFARVRIHTGAEANRSARSLNALAYTKGNDIVFAAAQYNPASAIGRQLLAHELAHVVQQSRGGATVQSPADEISLERDADQAAWAIARGNGITQIAGASDLRIARQQAAPELPLALSFLTPADVKKLQAFGDADYQSSLRALQGQLSKTKGFNAKGEPLQYIDTRQAAGELRTFLDCVRNPKVDAVKVVPSNMGGRSPDMYVRYKGGAEDRVEVYNITLASKDVRPDLGVDSQGRQVPRIPKVENEIPGKAPVVELPTKDFNITAVRDAIRSKIKPSPGGTTQLDAENPNTMVGGRQMATGGDVTIQVTNGEISKARIDEIILNLEPELRASSARKIVISAIDADEPRVGRKIFEYTLEGDKFVPSVRAPFYKMAEEPPLPGAITAAATAEEALLPETIPVMTPALGVPGSYLKAIGGFIVSALITLIIAYVIEKAFEAIARAEVEAALKKLEPSIDNAIKGKSKEIIEKQSASDEPLFAVISYDMTYRHSLPDHMAENLFFGDDPSQLELNQQFQDQRRMEQDLTYLLGATLQGVSLVSGTKPANKEDFSLVRDKVGLFEDFVYKFSTPVELQRISNVDLRDYVESQLAELEAVGDDTGSAGRIEQLQKRLEQLQGSVTKEETAKRAEAERSRKEEEKRKQAKLAAAQAALDEHPPTAAPFLTSPGPAPAQPLPPESDPFNLSGRPVSKSLSDQAEDAADIVEALKSKYVARASAIKSGNVPDDQVKQYKSEVENWIGALHQSYQAWKTKGSPEWSSVKRIEFVNWWVDQPEGRDDLLR